MSSSSSSAKVLLSQFRQAFSDVTLSATEAQQLRTQLVSFAQQGGDVVSLRHQLFELAKTRFNTFQDKAVVEWLEAASALLPAPAPVPETTLTGKLSTVFFSPGTECVAAIRRFIGEARQTLDVCVFTVADDRLTEALLAAYRRGIRIRLLTDNDKLFDRGSDVRDLHAAGVRVRTDATDYHMHHKFAISDSDTVLTGSYNWTRSAAEHNLENLLITADASIVRQYVQEFETLWGQMQDLAEQP